jgi:hypothetical protein
MMWNHRLRSAIVVSGLSLALLGGCGHRGGDAEGPNSGGNTGRVASPGSTAAPDGVDPATGAPATTGTAGAGNAGATGTGTSTDVLKPDQSALGTPTGSTKDVPTPGSSGTPK